MSSGEGDPPEGLRLVFGGAVQSVLVTVIGAAASLGFVAFIGGAVLWARFYALGLPPDQGVAVMPRTELVSTGAAALAGFGLAGALGVAGAYLLDRNGSVSRPTRFGLLLLTAAALWLIVHYAPHHQAIGYFVGAVVLATSVAIPFLAAQPPPEAPEADDPVPGVEPPPPVSLTRAGTAAQITIFALGALAFWLIFATPWIVASFGLAIGLYLAVMSIARSSGTRFAPYAVALFLAIVIFGGGLSALRSLELHQVQPIAAVRAGEADAVCGLFVTETSDRLYLGRLDIDRARPGPEVRGNTGHIFWLDKHEVTGWTLGALQNTGDAELALAVLRRRVLDERRRRVVVRDTTTRTGDKPPVHTVTTTVTAPSTAPAARPATCSVYQRHPTVVPG